MCPKWASKLKVQFQLKRYCSKFILTAVLFTYNPAFYFNMGQKCWRHAPSHISVITGNIPITVITFAHDHPLLPSNSTFITDSIYLDLSKLTVKWTLLLFNFSCIRDLAKRRKLFSIPVGEYASFSNEARTLKTNLLGLISNFSKYFFKTGTTCLLFSPTHVFVTLICNINHFGILFWKIVKPHDDNEIKPPIGKIFRKYKPITHYFVMSRKK